MTKTHQFFLLALDLSEENNIQLNKGRGMLVGNRSDTSSKNLGTFSFSPIPSSICRTAFKRKSIFETKPREPSAANE